MPLFMKVHGKSALERLIRGLLMVLLVAGVGYAFWWNNENLLQKIESRNAFYDGTGTISEEDRTFVKQFMRSLKKEYGIEARIRIENGPLDVPELNSKTLFIGLNPQGGEAVVVFPPLLRGAVGAELAETLEEGYFEDALEGDEWPEKLRLALVMLWSRLTELKGTGGETRE